MLKRITSKLHASWNDLPIRLKMAVALGLILGIMWIIVFYNVYSLRSFTGESGQIMERYDEVTEFMRAFSAENGLMDAYVRPSHTVEDERAYIESGARTDELAAELLPDLKTDPHAEYMVKRAIAAAMETYRGDSEKLIGASDNVERIRLFVMLGREADYIEGYAMELLGLRMTAGENKWNELDASSRRNSRVMLGFMIFATAATVLGLLLLLHTIIRPVTKLSDAADAISRGVYDAPPLDDSSGDEIGRTAHSFNLMQSQIKKTIRAIEREAEMEKENARIQKALQDSRYAELQSQIDPHFLFNTLNTIAALASEEGAPIAEDLIGRLAKIFRYSLEDSEKPVSLGQELQYLSDYMELMEARFAGRISMVIEPFDEALTERTVPKFLLQTLAENSIIHGFKNMSEGGEITVRIDADEEDRLRIVVADNGCGFDSSSTERTGPHKSVGLDNIRERLGYLGGSMEIDSVIGEGTAVTIIIDGREEDDQDTGG